MTKFAIHTTETAGESAPILESANKAFGFVPNLLAIMAESPQLLEGYMTLAGIFDKTNLSEAERQIILMTNNRINGCTYCMAAHTTISQMKGVPADVIESLRNATPIADAKLETLRTFAEKVNTSRGWPEESDLQALFDAGYDRRTVLEVVLGTALKVLSNYTNHISGTPVDKAFSTNVWSQPEPAVAAAG